MVGMFRDFYINYCLTTTSKEFIVVKFCSFLCCIEGTLSIEVCRYFVWCWKGCVLRSCVNVFGIESGFLAKYINIFFLAKPLSFMSSIDYFCHVKWIMELYWFHGHFFFFGLSLVHIFFVYIWFFFFFAFSYCFNNYFVVHRVASVDDL